VHFALGRAGTRASFLLALANDVSVSACSRLVSEGAPRPTTPIRPQGAAPAAHAMDVPESLEASCAAGRAKDCLAQPEYSTAARAAERLRSGSKVYWLEPGGDDGTECRQYQVRGNSLVGEWTPDINGGARSRTSYQWVRSGRFVWLGGPLISTRDGRLTTVRCMHDYEIVDEKDGAILLVDGGSEKDPLVAFEPRRAERWYPTREACEAVRASEVRVDASEGPSRATFAALSGIHSGC
jgi:hypothetical protein